MSKFHKKYFFLNQFCPHRFVTNAMSTKNDITKWRLLNNFEINDFPSPCYVTAFELIAYLRGWPDIWLYFFMEEGMIQIFTSSKISTSLIQQMLAFKWFKTLCNNVTFFIEKHRGNLKPRWT